MDLSMGSTKFPRALEVRRRLYEAANGGQSTRYRRLDRLDAFYKSLEYQHQDRNWDGRSADALETISPEVVLPSGFVQPAANELSVLQKRPTAPLRLCPMVVDRFTGLLFSKKRTPKVKVEGDPDAEDFLGAAFKRGHFWRAMYLARTFGGSMGSALVTVQLRRGRFSYSAVSPKCVQEVVWEDPDLKIPAGVLIQYLFEQQREVLDDKTGRPTGGTRSETWVYRRIVDEEWDLTFVPARLDGDQMPDEMQVDQRASYQHSLGRFPGAWIQNLPSDEDLDGVPDCEGAFQMFDTIDRQVSQSNKGLMFNQDPTLVYGRDKKLDQLGVPLKKGSENALNVGIGGFANYLELTGGGIQAAGEFVKTLRGAAMDKVQCVLADPEKMAGAAQSALAIELLYQPMLEKADRLRQQYEDAIEQLAQATLDLARAWSDPLRYEGNVRRAVFDLPPRIVERDAAPSSPDPKLGQVVELVPRHPGVGGLPVIEWGPYFVETPADLQAKVTVWITAYNGGLVDLESAVRAICRILELEDVEGVLRRVREEAAERKASAMASLAGPPEDDEAEEVQLEPAPEVEPEPSLELEPPQPLPDEPPAP